MLKRCAIACVFVLATGGVQASSPCEALLNQGVWNRDAVDMTYSARSHLRSFLLSDRAATYASAQKFAGQASIPIQGILVGAGMNSTGTNYQQVRSTLIQELSSSWFEDADYSRRIVSASEALLDAYSECVDTYFGLHAWIVPGGDGYSFQVGARYRSTSTSHPNTKHWLVIENATCQGVPTGEADATDLGAAEQSYSCSATDPFQTTTVRIQTADAGGTQVLVLPALERTRVWFSPTFECTVYGRPGGGARHDCKEEILAPPGWTFAQVKAGLRYKDPQGGCYLNQDNFRAGVSTPTGDLKKVELNMRGRSCDSNHVPAWFWLEAHIRRDDPRTGRFEPTPKAVRPSP